MWFAGFALLITSCYGQLTQKQEVNARQLLHYPPAPGLTLNPQPNLLTHQRGLFPPLEQQILIYQGGLPGQQPFLLQPGAPPGNFLIPQPQPGFVLRDVPQRPSFYPGAQPKPAFTPPINKDAEEIPTNPAAIPPFRSQDLKPEKLETFDEKPENPQQTDVESELPKNASPLPGLRPGQRFFILNGQPLFSNYPLHFINQPAYQQPGRFYFEAPTAEFSKVPPPQYNLPQVPIEDFLLRNGITGEISNVRLPTESQTNHQNVITLNQPFTDYKTFLPYSLPTPLTENKKIITKSAPSKENRQKLEPIIVPDDLQTKNFDDFRYESANDDDTVVIEAKYDDVEKDTEVIHSNDKKDPSTSQAQPGAIALAGPGGVASAGPRGTALVGDGGLAVASPKATAVAGPRDEDKRSKNKKPK